MEIPQAFYRTSIKALITDEQGRFLLCKEANEYWELPGGGLDLGETPERGLRRELNEEMSLEVLEMEKEPSFFVVWSEDGIGRTNIVYRTKVKNLEFTPSDECVEVRFFTAQEVLENEANRLFLPNVSVFAKQYTT